MSLMRLTANLDRSDGQTPWGFRLAGGREAGFKLTIQKVNENSLAARCGMMSGDVITHIGSTDAEHLTHREAQDIIMRSGNRLTLKLERHSCEVPRPVQTPYQPAHPQAYHSAHQSSQPQAYQPPPWMDQSHGSGSIPSHVPHAAHAGHASSPRPAAGQPIAWTPKVPQGDRKMLVYKAGQASMLESSLHSRIPVCAKCCSQIRGPFISALDKTWCPNHFTCSYPNCQSNLLHCGFVEEANELYCEKDYEKYFAPSCGTCGRVIIGEVVNALKKTFHVQCFTCSVCRKEIGSGNFHQKDGKIYCPQDWSKMFQVSCHGCQFPVEPEDRWIEALGQNWHSECFNCASCQVNLEGQTFFTKNGKPFCNRHSNVRF